MAHRVSWLLHFEPPPTALLVMHKCDNPPCVNPDHLIRGTPKDNSTDCAVKGRCFFKKGHTRSKMENNGRAKLCRDDVAGIRVKLELGGGGPSIAKEYGVSYETIYQIRDRVIWKDI